MQIYRLRKGKTAFLSFINDRDARTYIESEHKINPQWEPLETYIMEGDDDFREGEPENGPKDFVVFGDSWACNERAYLALREQCKGDVEFLPLHCSGEVFYWMNTLATINALDYEKSKFARDIYTGQINFIGVYSFKPRELVGRTLFFLTDDHETLFATQDFVDFVSKERLEGIHFHLAGEAT